MCVCVCVCVFLPGLRVRDEVDVITITIIHRNKTNAGGLADALHACNDDVPLCGTYRKV